MGTVEWSASYSNLGSTCEAPMLPITESPWACRAGMHYVGTDGNEFGGNEMEMSFPSGCYEFYLQSFQATYFNMHETGVDVPTSFERLYCHQGLEPLQQGRTLFLGGADIDYWQSSSDIASGSYNFAAADFGCLDVINEAEEITSQFEPSTVILGCGMNEIVNGYNVTDVVDMFTNLTDILISSGVTRILALSTNPTPHHDLYFEEFIEYDVAIKDFVIDLAREENEENPQVIYLDISEAFGKDDLELIYEVHDESSSDEFQISAYGYNLIDNWASKALDVDEESSCILWSDGICDFSWDSSAPTNVPSFEPSIEESLGPTVLPSTKPSEVISDQPSLFHSDHPSLSHVPSYDPTNLPSNNPTRTISHVPSIFKSLNPTALPSAISHSPSAFESFIPSINPTEKPSWHPTISLSHMPSVNPTETLSLHPTISPSYRLSVNPTETLSLHPSLYPSLMPSLNPTKSFSLRPTIFPTDIPTTSLTSLPTKSSTFPPSYYPTVEPTSNPIMNPTKALSFHPTLLPSITPTSYPLSSPVDSPSNLPTDANVNPTIWLLPTSLPSHTNSNVPSPSATAFPSKLQTSFPDIYPTQTPFSIPSGTPTDNPSNIPSSPPTSSLKPTSSLRPSRISSQPSSNPSIYQLSMNPTVYPSLETTSDIRISSSFDNLPTSSCAYNFQVSLTPTPFILLITSLFTFCL